MSISVSYLRPEQLQLDLGIRDLSDPAEGPHAVQILIDRAVKALSRAWDREVRWCRGPKIVPIADNYDRLGYAAGAITREATPGAAPGQKNLLLRVVLRDLEQTLTNEAANSLRDRVYAALHQGTQYQWAQ